MKDLMSKLGYNFKDKSLLKKALTHKSLSSQNNERLEFLGDALLNLHVSEHLYSRFDSLDEGKLTQFKAKLVSRENLTKIAENLELSRFIRAGKGEKLVDNSIVGNTLEALIGAVYLDSSLSRVNQVLNNC
jgi:dsRNA-specific ribonuclease